MGLPANYNYYMFTGDITGRQVQYKSGGAAVDLTGCTIEWRFEMHDATLVVATVASGQLTVADVTGTITLSLDGPETADMTGRGRHWLRITAPYVKTLLTGEVIAST